MTGRTKGLQEKQPTVEGGETMVMRDFTGSSVSLAWTIAQLYTFKQYSLYDMPLLLWVGQAVAMSCDFWEGYTALSMHGGVSNCYALQSRCSTRTISHQGVSSGVRLETQIQNVLDTQRLLSHRRRYGPGDLPRPSH